MSLLRRLVRDVRAAAAAELALVMPLLLLLMTGAIELGNYFYNEHILVKAVRDGARYAARQDFSNYDACSGSVVEPIFTNTRNLVGTGVLAGGSDRMMNWGAATFTMTMSCTTTAGGQTMTGIYRGRASGAPRVMVDASVPYPSFFGVLGLTDSSLRLRATEEAAVMGL